MFQSPGGGAASRTGRVSRGVSAVCLVVVLCLISFQLSSRVAAERAEFSFVQTGPYTATQRPRQRDRRAARWTKQQRGAPRRVGCVFQIFYVWFSCFVTFPGRFRVPGSPLQYNKRERGGGSTAEGLIYSVLVAPG